MKKVIAYTIIASILLAPYALTAKSEGLLTASVIFGGAFALTGIIVWALSVIDPSSKK